MNPTINLQERSSTKLNNIRLGFGWDSSAMSGMCNIDVSAFGCLHNKGNTSGPKLISNDWHVYFNNLSSPGGTIHHSGDILPNNIDDEVIYIDLKSAPDTLDEIAFVLTIYQADSREQDFSQIKDLYIIMYNDDTDEVLYKFIANPILPAIAYHIGNVYRKNTQWYAQGLYDGYLMDLPSIIERYSN